MTPLLLFAATFILTKILIGDVQARIAWDAGLAATQYLRTIDETNLSWASQQIASIPYWLPALLSRYVHFSLKDSIIFFSYFQFVAMGFTLFRFARLVSGSKVIAWFSLFFFFATDPISWNLAMAGTYKTMYAWQCALPFIFLTLCELLENRPRRVGCYLLIAGLIQPPAVIYLLPAIAIYYFKNRPLKDLILVCVFGGVALLPSSILVVSHSNALSRSEMIVAMMKWAHGVPWKYPQYAASSFFVTVTAITSGAVALFSASDVRPEARKLWLSLLLAATLIGLLSMPAYYFRIPEMLQLMPLRATGIVSMAAIPFILLYAWQGLNGDTLAKRLAGAVFLFYPLLFWKKFLWLPNLLYVGLTSFTKDASQRKTKLFIVIFASLTAFTILGAVLYGKIVLRTWMKIEAESYVGAPFKNHLFVNFLVLVVGAAAVGFAVGVARRFSPRAVTIFTCIVFAAAAVNQCRIIGLESRAPAEQTLLDAQLWAATSTPTDTKIITLYPNILSPVCKRQPVYTQESLIEYLVTPDRLQHWRDLKEFYGANTSGSDYLHSVEVEGFPATAADEAAFKSLDENGIVRFAERFGGDYLFVDKSFKKYSFPVAHENESYIFYLLKPSP